MLFGVSGLLLLVVGEGGKVNLPTLLEEESVQGVLGRVGGAYQAHQGEWQQDDGGALVDDQREAAFDGLEGHLAATVICRSGGRQLLYHRVARTSSGASSTHLESTSGLWLWVWVWGERARFGSHCASRLAPLRTAPSGNSCADPGCPG